MRRLAADAAALVPPLGRLRAQRDDLAKQVAELQLTVEGLRATRETSAELEELRGREPAYSLFPPGHFYSPIPDLDDVRSQAPVLFDRAGDVPAVNISLEDQWEFLEELAPSLKLWPYGDDAGGHRYRPDNGFFGWTDSQVWFSLLAHGRPRKIIEVGSGWSTALVLDACDLLDLAPDIIAVEPYPDRLRSVMRPGDDSRIRLVEKRAQDVLPSELADLESGDVLFIDSTHVSKIGSDVNHLLFSVFPLLKPGVLVHVHDIAYPFEYPQEWVLEGRAWNEAYLLRAFLMQNPQWRVLLWPSMLWLRDADRMASMMRPGTLVDGGSLWLITQ